MVYLFIAWWIFPWRTVSHNQMVYFSGGLNSSTSKHWMLMLANPPMFKGYTFIIPCFFGVETSKVGYPISSGEDSLDIPFPINSHYPLILAWKTLKILISLRSIPDFWGRFELGNPTASSLYLPAVGKSPGFLCRANRGFQPAFLESAGAAPIDCRDVPVSWRETWMTWAV